MRKTIVTVVATFVLGSITTGVLLAQRQPPPMPPPGAGGPPMGRGPWAGQGMGPARMSPGGMDQGGMGQGQWGERMRERQAHRMEMMHVLALVGRAEDRKLTPPDVQKIAEAFLLWNGNHTWKVINVKPEGDVIGFDLATAENSVIAHFTMDPKTGRPARPG